jgi:hypothetical protein
MNDENKEMKEMGTKELLQAFSDDNSVISDEMFEQLKVKFSQAMNMSKCPCESDKEYQFCCKPLWQYVERVFKKKRRDEKADSSKTKWFYRVGVGNEGYVMEALNKKIQIGEMFEAASVVHNQLLVQVTSSMAANNIMRMQQQMQAQNVASVNPNGKSFRGL